MSAPRFAPARALLVAVTCLALSVTGCLMKAYPGPSRGDEEVATLRPSPGMAGTTILLESVDGRPLRWPQEGAELLPGSHRLRVSLLLRSGLRQRMHRFDLDFEAEGGGEYVIFGELSAHGPRIWVADAELATVAESDLGLAAPRTPGVGARPRR